MRRPRVRARDAGPVQVEELAARLIRRQQFALISDPLYNIETR